MSTEDQGLTVKMFRDIPIMH
jgi:hypothetical protein